MQSDGHEREELLSKFRDAGSSVKTIFMSSVSFSLPSFPFLLSSASILLSSSFPARLPRTFTPVWRALC